MHGLTTQNITLGFHSTGIFLFNREVFSEADFEASSVTNRDFAPGENAPAFQPLPTPISQHEQITPALEGGSTPPGQPRITSLQPGSSPSPQPLPASASQEEPVSSQLQSNPDPGPSGRSDSQPGPSRRSDPILHQDPMEDLKSLFKANPRVRRSTTPSTSFSECDSDDMNTWDSSERFCDFVVVQFKCAKSRVPHCIARVDLVDSDEYEGVFLQREASRLNTVPTFIIKENDRASFPLCDVIKKLPIPKHHSSSRRKTNISLWFVAIWFLFFTSLGNTLLSKENYTSLPLHDRHFK